MRELAPPAGGGIPDDDGFLLVPPRDTASERRVIELARKVRAATDLAPLWVASEGRNLLRIQLGDHLAADPAWLGVALDPALVSVAARYLGSVPLLWKAQLWVSPWAERDLAGRLLEHRYHCDWGDMRQLRMLLFVEDLTRDHGPLTMIGARRSGELRRTLRYSFDEEDSALTDEIFFSAVSRDEQRPLVGPPGTVAFADTSRCFHQGSRVLRPGLERVMVMFQYVTIASFKIDAARLARPPFAHLAAPRHGRIERLVLGAE
ncbi:MAG: hypothetical protein HMLKMBBP_00139 [Planctomycetes bacterium]|nr:hypothetical protein [Planctomycetota bacterium]